MTSQIKLGKNVLIPLAEAIKLVPYSKDYLSRLAREEKVTAMQVNRQWMFDSDSLQKFHEQSQIEETVKRQHLRELRKQELLVRDDFSKKIATLKINHTTAAISSVHLKVMAVVVCGITAGFFLYTTGWYSSQPADHLLALLPQNIITFWLPGNKESNLSNDFSVVQFYDAIEMTENISSQNGIVLLPAKAQGQSANVEEWFSDKVEVEMIDETKGEVRLETPSGESVSLPFVKIPDSKLRNLASPSNPSP